MDGDVGQTPDPLIGTPPAASGEEAVPASEVQKRVLGFQQTIAKKDLDLTTARQLNAQLQAELNSLKTQVQTVSTEKEKAVTELTAQVSTLAQERAALQEQAVKLGAQISQFSKREVTETRLAALDREVVPFYKAGILSNIEDLDDAALKAKVDNFKTVTASLLNPQISQQRSGQTANPQAGGNAVDLKTWTDVQIYDFLNNPRANKGQPHWDAVRVEWVQRNRPKT